MGENTPSKKTSKTPKKPRGLKRGELMGFILSQLNTNRKRGLVTRVLIARAEKIGTTGKSVRLCLARLQTRGEVTYSGQRWYLTDAVPLEFRNSKTTKKVTKKVTKKTMKKATPAVAARMAKVRAAKVTKAAKAPEDGPVTLFEVDPLPTVAEILNTAQPSPLDLRLEGVEEDLRMARMVRDLSAMPAERQVQINYLAKILPLIEEAH